MEMSLVRKGTIGELQVQIELLKRGFDVFENICDDNGIDLICIKNKKIMKIQVKTAKKTSLDKHSGVWRYGFGLGNTDNKCDFFICVVPEGFLIIEGNRYTGKAFQWNPNSQKPKIKGLLNNWNLLDPDKYFEGLDKLKGALFNEVKE